MSYVPGYDFNLQVARGLVGGISAVNKFGRNPDVDIGTEDLWGGGALWVAPTAARVHNITGGANDTAAGTGARTVSVNGLNGSYVDTTETVIMNGAGGVNTVNSFVIIHRKIVLTAGSDGVNSGAIVATAAVDGTVSNTILAGKGQTQFCIYMIPAGKTGYLQQYDAGLDAGATANVEVELFATPFGGALNLKGTVPLSGAGTSYGIKKYPVPLEFAEKTLLRLRATSDANNVNVVGTFDLYLVTN